VKPGSAALVLSSLSLCIFLLLSFVPPANCLAAFSLLVAASLLADASLPPVPKATGRKRGPKDPDKLLAQAKVNGYQRREHREQDVVPNRHAYVDKTIYNQVGLHDAELTPEPEQPGRQWVSTCDSVGLDGETTDPDPDSETLFSFSLRSPFPTRTSVGEFSGCSSDTAVDPVPDEPLLTPGAELLSGALDRNTAGADGQSHAAAKPIRIRLRLKPLSGRPQGNKIILRLKGPKLGKRARKGRKKARWNGQVNMYFSVHHKPD
jgi:hypothetical protein